MASCARLTGRLRTPGPGRRSPPGCGAAGPGCWPGSGPAWWQPLEGWRCVVIRNTRWVEMQDEICKMGARSCGRNATSGMEKRERAGVLRTSRGRGGEREAHPGGDERLRSKPRALKPELAWAAADRRTVQTEQPLLHRSRWLLRTRSPGWASAACCGWTGGGDSCSTQLETRTCSDRNMTVYCWPLPLQVT